jgi:drug/metabolite transporter (DMT)-like permease
MTRPALIANLVTLLAFPTPAAAAPVVPAAVPPPAEVNPIAASAAGTASGSDEVDVMVAQVVAAYLIGVGGTMLLGSAGAFPDTGSDTANLGLLAAVPLTLTTAAVCGTGLLSSRYQGRCTTTLLGAVVGALLGVVIGVVVAPAEPQHPEDLPPRVIASVICVGLFMPMGAVAGWELGKRDIGPPALLTARPSRNLMVPVLSLRW